MEDAAATTQAAGVAKALQLHAARHTACASCGLTDGLSMCRRCCDVKYCFDDCQIADFDRHKHVCVPATPSQTTRRPASFPMNGFFYHQTLRHWQVAEKGLTPAETARVAELTAEDDRADHGARGRLTRYMILSKLFNVDEYKHFDLGRKVKLDASGKGYSLFRTERFANAPASADVAKNKALGLPEWLALNSDERDGFEKRGVQVAAVIHAAANAASLKRFAVRRQIRATLAWTHDMRARADALLAIMRQFASEPEILVRIEPAMPSFLALMASADRAEVDLGVSATAAMLAAHAGVRERWRALVLQAHGHL